MASLGSKGLARLQAEIERLDPEARYVSIDVRDHTVRYGDGIVLHREIHSYEGEEEPARSFLVAWLCTTGGYLPANIELEKEYSLGRPKIGGRLDILLRHVDGTPFSLVEVKAPDEFATDQDKFISGHLFDIAPMELGCSVLCFATVRETTTAIEPEAIRHYVLER